MAAVLGLDDDQVEVACRRADGDVWVANFNAPGQVVIAGSADGVAAAGAIAKELGAKKVMPLPVSRRLPHAVHGAGPRPPAQGDRRGRRPATPRCRSSSNVDALPHDHGERVGQPAVGAAVAARCAGSTACSTLADARRHRLRRARPGRRAHRHGQAHRRRRPHHLASPTPDDLDKLLELGRRRRAADARRRSRASTCSPPSGSSSARRPACSRPSASLADGARSTSGDGARPRRRRTRCARRSPACCRATSPSTASGSRCRQPIAWLRTV